jgi:hypothetical protein
MTRAEFATGSATFLIVIAIGLPSSTWVDRHYAEAALPASQVTPTSSAACVGADGSWKNWVWANVPMLSPNCEGNR